MKWEPLETEAMSMVMLVGHSCRGWALAGLTHKFLAASLHSYCHLKGQISTVWCPGSTGPLSHLPKPHQLFTSPRCLCAGDLERASLPCQNSHVCVTHSLTDLELPQICHCSSAVTQSPQTYSCTEPWTTILSSFSAKPVTSGKSSL